MKRVQTNLMNWSGLGYIFLSCLLMVSVVSCSDDGGDGPSDSKTYQLEKRSDIGGDGTALFEKLSDSETRITISLNNDDSGQASPSHIHHNSALETGDIYITLEPVINGMSVSTITEADDGTPISYEELLDFDGYINVHESENDLENLLAQGDIGSNELTGDEKQYDLEERNGFEVRGTVTFMERKSGEAIAEFDLENTTGGVMHPAHIHENDFVETGQILLTFNPIDGETGMSLTHISKLDDGTPFVYEDVEEVDGYINVHLSSSDLTVVSQTDIGINELTGASESYDLDEVDNSGITGKVTFFERRDGTTLAEVEVEGGPGSIVHPAHIHDGSVEDAPGDIILTFTPIPGDEKRSYTSITQLDDGSPMNFEMMKDIDGYVNIHLSTSDLTVVAQGDVGRNN